MSGAWKIRDFVGAQNIDVSDTVQNHKLGTIIRAYHDTYGEAEFIYLLGVASTAIGSVVTYEASGWQTALAPVGTSLPKAVAIAMSANVASQYGWYQISGRAVAKKTCGLALGAAAAIGVKTAGLVAATGSGKEIQGAITVAVSTNSTSVTLMINRPHMQGRLT